MAKRSAPDTAAAASPEAAATDGASDVKRARIGRVIGFYGHSGQAPYRCFSNFFHHEKPFSFKLPQFAQKPGFQETVMCEFAEKAIMVTKAALFGDAVSFQKMLVAKQPKLVKSLGRGVSSFNNKIWSEHLNEIAFEVVCQKFASDPKCAEVLLSTGEATIAEATKNDKIWGIGIDVGDPRVQDPATWQGKNVLGTALMKTRGYLREQAEGKKG